MIAARQIPEAVCKCLLARYRIFCTREATRETVASHLGAGGSLHPSTKSPGQLSFVFEYGRVQFVYAGHMWLEKKQSAPSTITPGFCKVWVSGQLGYTFYSPYVAAGHYGV
jgi:hypothetical protein